MSCRAFIENSLLCMFHRVLTKPWACLKIEVLAALAIFGGHSDRPTQACVNVCLNNVFTVKNQSAASTIACLLLEILGLDAALASDWDFAVKDAMTGREGDQYRRLIVEIRVQIFLNLVVF
jgi:hypothetical protein